MIHKYSFMSKGLNTFNQGGGTVQSNHYRTTRTSIEKGGLKPVYMENRQFFKDLTSLPFTTDRTHVDKETINESVYGKNWRQKMNRSTIKMSQKRNLEENLEISPDLTTKNKREKKFNLNDPQTLYLTSEDEEDTDFTRQKNDSIDEIKISDINSQHNVHGSFNANRTQ